MNNYAHINLTTNGPIPLKAETTTTHKIGNRLFA